MGASCAHARGEPPMKRHAWIALSVAALTVSAGVWTLSLRLAAQAPGRTATTVNWPLHNLDLAGTRYSPLDQINRSNVKSLTPRWLFQHGVIDGVSNQTTPIVVDGTMYVTDSRGSVYAVNAADGHLLWTFDVTPLIGGGAKEGYVFRNRGAVYSMASCIRPAALFCSRSTPRPARRSRGSARAARR